VLAERALHEGAEGARGGECPVVRRERDQSVAVDCLEPRHALPCGALEESGNHEGRHVVGDDHRRTRRQVLQQPAALARRRLDERHVPGGGSRCGARVVGHAVEHEPVQSVARPAVGDVERLQHHERPADRERQVDGMLQREVPLEPARADHPVEHHRAVGADRLVHQDSDA
jgi:hypothetical protein